LGRDQNRVCEIFATGEPRSPVMTSRGERGIWQRRYWEHTIRDNQDFVTHMDYTHFNPVKHGLVEHPADWPHSSFRRCVASGLYPPGWMGGAASHKTPASGG
jgi:putative transposase